MSIHSHRNYCKNQFENLTFSQMTFREISHLNRTTFFIFTHKTSLFVYNVRSQQGTVNNILTHANILLFVCLVALCPNQGGTGRSVHLTILFPGQA